MARMNHALKAEQDAIAPRCACGAAVEDRTATARNGHARSRMTRHQGQAVLPGISQFGPEDTPRGSTVTPMSSTEDPPGAPWLPRRLVDRPVVSRPARVAEVEGRSFVHELALAHGLGLVGVGAPAAIREFLIEALAFKEPGSTVIVVPALDLAELLGQRTLALPHRPAGLEVTATFDDALDLLEIHALSRAMGPSGNDPYTRWRPTFILIASTSRYDRARLQVTLDLGSGYGIAGLLHGQWAPGVTVSVRADGSAGPGDPGLSKLMRDVPLGGISAELAADRLARLGRERPRFAPPLS
jgi:hypothetical protein